MELSFEIREAEEGGYHARALGHAIFTQGDTWEELRRNIVAAAGLHFEGAAEQPTTIKMIAPDIETRFHAGTAQGSAQRGLKLLDKLDRAFQKR